MAITLLDQKYYVDELFTVTRNKYCDIMNEPSHTHDFCELIYVFKGTCIHCTDSKKYIMNPGDLLFVNYGSSHSFQSDKHLEYVNIIIKPDFISKSLSGVENAFALLTLSDFSEFSKTVDKAKRHMHFSDIEQMEIETLIGIMENEKKKSQAGSDVIIRSCLDAFLTMVFRKMSLNLSDRMYLNTELLTYIKNNCAKNLTLKKIAAMCYYNSSYFSRAFKNFTGKSFVSFLLDCRMESACNMLENSDKKIDTIILQNGFTNRTAFFKAFFSRTGMTPLQYRKSKK